MNTEKLTEIFIGSGAALDAGSTAMASMTSQIGIIGGDMTALTAGNTVSTANREYLYLVNKLANGDRKRSFPINGMSVIGYKGETYAPAAREVWSIGYSRKTASGSVEVNNDTNYEFTIRFKNDKTFYSERAEELRLNFQSAVAATQLTVATQIAALINNSSYGSQPSGIKEVIAVVVGDGSGVYGLTGAANYGVEITALTINQFQNTTYSDNLVYFSVHVNDASGFGATTCTEIQAATRGTGTYNQVYNMENKFYGNEGVLNRTKWPIPTLAYLTASAGTLSGTIAAFTVTGTIAEDKVTFSAAASTQLPAGSLVVLGGTSYEIKYYISTTVAILTAVLSAGLIATTVAATAFYDIINIQVSDVSTLSGAGVGQFSKKWLVIATPAIDAGITVMTTASTGTAALLAILNPWMTSTPLAPTALTL